MDAVRSSINQQTETLNKTIKEQTYTLKYTINQQTEAFVGKIDDLEEIIVEKMDEVHGGIRAVGQELGTKIDFMHTMIDANLTDMNGKLSTINESLEELVTLAKTPSQVWAFEQFEQARHAYQNHWFNETLDYIDRAINGYGDHVGNQLEHRFYLLKGGLHLGGTDVGNHEQVNLELAQENFKLAVRYATGVNEINQAMGLKMLGWAYLCDGKIKEAEEPLKQSIALNTPPDAEAYFFNAQIDWFNGHKNQARTNLAKAIYYNPYYAFKAYNTEHLVMGEAEEKIINQSIDIAAAGLKESISSITQQINSTLDDVNKHIENFHLEKQLVKEPIVLSPSFTDASFDQSKATIFALNKDIKGSLLDFVKEMQDLKVKLAPKALKIKHSRLEDSFKTNQAEMENDYNVKVESIKKEEKSLSIPMKWAFWGVLLLLSIKIIFLYLSDPLQTHARGDIFLTITIGAIFGCAAGLARRENKVKNMKSEFRRYEEDLSDVLSEEEVSLKHKKTDVTNNFNKLDASLSDWLNSIDQFKDTIHKNANDLAIATIEQKVKDS